MHGSPRLVLWVAGRKHTPIISRDVNIPQVPAVSLKIQHTQPGICPAICSFQSSECNVPRNALLQTPLWVGALKMLTQAYAPIHSVCLCSVFEPPSLTFSLLPSTELPANPSSGKQFRCFPDVQSPRQRRWASSLLAQQLAGPEPAYCDSARESQRLPQFSDSHNRSPLGTSSSEPCSLPEIVFPAPASCLRYPFGFPVVLQEACSGGPFSLPQRWVASMKMHFGLTSRRTILSQDATGHCPLVPESGTATPFPSAPSRPAPNPSWNTHKTMV